MAILSALRRTEPDLVWYNIGVSAFGRSPLSNLFGFISLYIAHLSGLPTVVTLHELVELIDLKTLQAPGGSLAPIGARLLTNIAIRADVVCLTMRRYANWLSAKHPGLTCIHIPIGAYGMPEYLTESRSSEILFFGSLAPYKGLDILINVYAELASSFPRLQLTIAGADHPRFPDYRRRLQSRYSDLAGVNWLGTVPEDRIRSLFERAQIVVLPYEASTGSSSVLYQAAMWGRAMVVSDLEETQAALMESGLKAQLFRARDAASLSKALVFLLNHPEHRQAQSAHNFRAIQHRRPDITCAALLQAFNLALEARRSTKQIEIPAQSPSELI
jgi:glycosyltransferase involved in cell wall biosynthesis